MTLPQAPTSTTAQSIIMGIQPDLTAMQTDVSQAQTAVNDERSFLSGLMEKIGMKGAREVELQQAAGLPEQQVAYNKINTDIASIQNSLNQAKANLRGSGLTQEQIQQQENQLNREAGFKLTDLEIRRAVAGQEITRLQNAIESKLKLEFEPLETQLQIRQMWYEDNKDALTRAEQRQFEVQQTLFADKLSQAKENRTAISSILLEAAQNGINIPDNVVQQIQTAPDAQTAYAILARNGISLENPLEAEAKRESILTSRAQRAKINAETAKAEAESKRLGSMANLNPDAPDYVEQVLAASAGGKAPAVEERRSLNKSFTVLSQLDLLQRNIGKEQTGPITGFIRSRNPYDTKAQLIQRELTAIVPNLARGVFGEVGVLTDNDVRLYSRTMAGLTATADVNKAVQALTLKTVQRSIEDQLQTMAASGIDVSKFKNQYLNVKNTVNRLEIELGVKNNETVNAKASQFDEI
jgi:hypothetical protein